MTIIAKIEELEKEIAELVEELQSYKERRDTIEENIWYNEDALFTKRLELNALRKTIREERKIYETTV